MTYPRLILSKFPPPLFGTNPSDYKGILPFFKFAQRLYFLYPSVKKYKRVHFAAGVRLPANHLHLLHRNCYGKK